MKNKVIPKKWRVAYRKKTNTWLLQINSFWFFWFTVTHIDPMRGEVPMEFSNEQEAHRAMIYHNNIEWKTY